jgi:hypothetical protein
LIAAAPKKRARTRATPAIKRRVRPKMMRIGIFSVPNRKISGGPAPF